MKKTKGYLKLSKKDIYEKDFEVEYKGYKVEEVDSFLDIIYEDYKYIESCEQEYIKTIQDLENKIKSLKRDLEDKISLLEKSNSDLENLTRAGVNNSAIIKRISKLEKENYNK
ncbi:DivIVA domain-containing protein [Spiroplasma turonicum]|uniref:DivIVA domain-containing protein n=1 Tax=Spiroplasma turonicum TaxID=216946 RepID=A0A0K1P7D2_9MOLU|nr:DivIVA domain-containing protein [Spiroplasma turonicum]AKU80084.1 DivIVA domain-containing protein [Spiroplasma turonicum]ALX71085.1 DivIVA domain-containing protein [Spiroplasma turonicum]